MKITKDSAPEVELKPPGDSEVRHTRGTFTRVVAVDGVVRIEVYTPAGEFMLFVDFFPGTVSTICGEMTAAAQGILRAGPLRSVPNETP